MKTLEFIYQETEIHFLVNPMDKNVMVNATEMAKLFGKEPKDFLRLEGTKKFINYLVEKNNIVADVPRYIEEKIYYSNNKAGTFMTRKLALKFAAWLDVQFEDWIFDTMDSILFGKIDQVKNSMTEIQSTEEKLKEAIESAKKNGNEEALAIIDALNAHESAKKKKDKAMRMFTRQMKMDL